MEDLTSRFNPHYLNWMLTSSPDRRVKLINNIINQLEKLNIEPDKEEAAMFQLTNSDPKVVIQRLPKESQMRKRKTESRESQREENHRSDKVKKSRDKSESKKEKHRPQQSEKSTHKPESRDNQKKEKHRPDKSQTSTHKLESRESQSKEKHRSDKVEKSRDKSESKKEKHRPEQSQTSTHKPESKESQKKEKHRPEQSQTSTYKPEPTESQKKEKHRPEQSQTSTHKPEPTESQRKEKHRSDKIEKSRDKSESKKEKHRPEQSQTSTHKPESKESQKKEKHRSQHLKKTHDKEKEKRQKERSEHRSHGSEHHSQRSEHEPTKSQDELQSQRRKESQLISMMEMDEEEAQRDVSCSPPLTPGRDISPSTPGPPTPPPVVPLMELVRRVKPEREAVSTVDLTQPQPASEGSQGREQSGTSNITPLTTLERTLKREEQSQLKDGCEKVSPKTNQEPSIPEEKSQIEKSSLLLKGSTDSSSYQKQAPLTTLVRPVKREVIANIDQEQSQPKDGCEKVSPKTNQEPSIPEEKSQIEKISLLLKGSTDSSSYQKQAPLTTLVRPVKREVIANIDQEQSQPKDGCEKVSPKTNQEPSIPEEKSQIEKSSLLLKGSTDSSSYQKQAPLTTLVRPVKREVIANIDQEQSQPKDGCEKVSPKTNQEPSIPEEKSQIEKSSLLLKGSTDSSSYQKQAPLTTLVRPVKREVIANIDQELSQPKDGCEKVSPKTNQEPSIPEEKSQIEKSSLLLKSTDSSSYQKQAGHKSLKIRHYGVKFVTDKSRSQFSRVNLSKNKLIKIYDPFCSKNETSYEIMMKCLRLCGQNDYVCTVLNKSNAMENDASDLKSVASISTVRYNASDSRSVASMSTVRYNASDSRSVASMSTVRYNASDSRSVASMSTVVNRQSSRHSVATVAIRHPPFYSDARTVVNTHIGDFRSPYRWQNPARRRFRERYPPRRGGYSRFHE